MALIIDLASAKLRLRNKPRDVYFNEEHWYCLNCDGDAFRLYSAGQILCCQCGQEMTNLHVIGQA